MSTQHTPGPWVVECDKFIATPDAIVIAELNNGLRGEYPKSGHFNANAQLIAAAPELLRTLTNLINATNVNADELDPLTVFVAIEQAKGAIAKATGDV